MNSRLRRWLIAGVMAGALAGFSPAAILGGQEPAPGTRADQLEDSQEARALKARIGGDREKLRADRQQFGPHSAQVRVDRQQLRNDRAALRTVRRDRRRDRRIRRRRD